MFKTTLFLLLFAFSVPGAMAQCITAPAPPDCLGTEPLITNNETLSGGTTKWFYGATTTFSTLTINGGTLVVCGDLTVDQFYMTSGKIFVRPGARFVIGSGLGSGLIFNADCQVYNYGTLEIQRNLSFDIGATAAQPTILVNATPSSVLKMSNQYFVINSPYSWFVNNGSAEFWGIITDAMSTPGSVCLGDGSSTRMAVLINKIADAYVVPSGTSCVNVYQLSQFSNRLTNTPNLYVCLGNTHNSYSGCGGCPANNWGMAQIFTDCVNCGAISVLGTGFTNFNATHTGEGNRLQWSITPVETGSMCKVMRSSNGIHYFAIDSISVRDARSSFFTIVDKNPIPGNNYYMINYIEPGGRNFNSKTVKVIADTPNEFTIFPTPFKKQFYIKYNHKIEQIILTDITGRNIPIRSYPYEGSSQLTVELLDHIQSGIYIVHIRTEKNTVARTIFKE